MGLVRGHTVASDELADMIRTVRHRGIFAERTFEIDRGEGEALVLDGACCFAGRRVHSGAR